MAFASDVHEREYSDSVCAITCCDCAQGIAMRLRKIGGISVNLMYSVRPMSRVDHKEYEAHHNRTLSWRLQSIVEVIVSSHREHGFMRAWAMRHPYIPILETGALGFEPSCWSIIAKSGNYLDS
jgi:hypothetical protein